MVHNATAYSCLRSMTAITEVARELNAELKRLTSSRSCKSRSLHHPERPRLRFLSVP
jgi:hypothetical protein